MKEINFNYERMILISSIQRMEQVIDKGLTSFHQLSGMRDGELLVKHNKLTPKYYAAVRKLQSK